MTPEQLKKLRREWNMSQIELAEELGVKQPRISEWEKGVNPIPVYIVKLLECLKIRVK